jgi:hypothetical protein
MNLNPSYHGNYCLVSTEAGSSTFTFFLKKLSIRFIPVVSALASFAIPWLTFRFTPGLSAPVDPLPAPESGVGWEEEDGAREGARDLRCAA